MVSNAANVPVGIDDSDDSGMPELEPPATASAAAAGSPTSTIGGVDGASAGNATKADVAHSAGLKG